ncbi:GTP-binding protein SAR1 [Pancytospora epiphaga]|nr:GTP-binding protein SAR1 [Pancytospora epiphaga]
MGSLTTVSFQIRQKLSEIYDLTIGRLISRLFKKPSSVLFLGIDNAGKTTLVNKLKNNTNHVFLPTKHATEDVIEIGNLKATVVDIGGHRAVRVAWKDYFFNVDGVVFIVDTADEQRFDEVREAWAAVRSLEREAPVLVLMNKIDLLGESSNSIVNNLKLMDELEGTLGIGRSTDGQNVDVAYVSVVGESTYNRDSRLYKAFEWLSDKINDRNKQKK